MAQTIKKDEKPVANYYDYMVFPLQLVGCWEWFENPTKVYQIMTNYMYLCVMLLVLVNVPVALMIHVVLGWAGFMSSLVIMSESLPMLLILFVVAYIAIYQKDLYELVEFANKEFKWHSASGITNMTMKNSYENCKKYALLYTFYILFIVSAYTVIPIVNYYISDEAELTWMYEDVNETVYKVLTLVKQCVSQTVIGIAFAQCGVFFVASSILMAGQLDLLCCSLRNIRYTALMNCGIKYETLAAKHADIRDDEQHNFSYNDCIMEKPSFHFDKHYSPDGNILSNYDIYDPAFDEATCRSMEDCARFYEMIKEFKIRFETFVSPILVIRIIHYTLYLCVLLYTTTLKFDLAMVEYLFAVGLDMFFHCYVGNQVIIQSDRVSEAAYQSAWIAMGVRSRRVLLNIMLSSRRSLVVRAANFVAIDLNTFIAIWKTSFSYYTLLVNVNDK